MADREQNHASNRGFASMDETKQRDIASRGGQASGGNFKNDPERASEAGRKGGQSVPPAERSFSRDRELAAEAGRRGGEHSHSVGRDVPEHSKEKDTEIAVEAGKQGGEHGHGGSAAAARSGEPIGARHDGDPRKGGTVGREIPEHSKAKDTETAVEAGKRGGEHDGHNR
jgi:hypothetical protein